jgi:hypothetical protein
MKKSTPKTLPAENEPSYKSKSHPTRFASFAQADLEIMLYFDTRKNQTPALRLGGT